MDNCEFSFEVNILDNGVCFIEEFFDDVELIFYMDSIETMKKFLMDYSCLLATGNDDISEDLNNLVNEYNGWEVVNTEAA